MRVPAGCQRTRCCAVLAVGGLFALSAGPAWAAPELITNGNFSNYTVNGAVSTTSYIVTGGTTSGTTGATLTGWSNNGYSFVYQPNTASSTGAVVNANTNLYLWGPDGGTSSTNYSNNGFTTSPTGGAFIAEDAAYQQGTLSQTVSGLVVGMAYQLSFYWAAAQQSGYDGQTTQAWNVSWTDSTNRTVSTYSTPAVTTANHGFSAWRQQAVVFTATTTSMTLGFMATGGPNGTPPFALLDGVSLTAAPEPGTWAVLAMGLAGMTALRLRRGRRV